MKLAKFLPQVILLMAITQAPSAHGGPAVPSPTVEVLDDAPVASSDIRFVWLMDLLMPCLLGIAVIGASRLTEYIDSLRPNRPAADRRGLRRRRSWIKSRPEP